MLSYQKVYEVKNLVQTFQSILKPLVKIGVSAQLSKKIDGKNHTNTNLR